MNHYRSRPQFRMPLDELLVFVFSGEPSGIDLLRERIEHADGQETCQDFTDEITAYEARIQALEIELEEKQ